MRAHVKGEKRHGSRREAAVIGLRRRPGGRMVAASPSLHWPAAHLGNGLRPSTRTEVDSGRSAAVGSRRGETCKNICPAGLKRCLRAIRRRGAAAGACFIRRVEAPLVFGGD